MPEQTPALPPPVLLKDGPIPRIYAEGISEISLGYPVVKMRLHSSSQQDQSVENSPQIRELCLELVMPTGAALEFANNILTAIGQNVAVVRGYQAEQTRRLDEFIAQLPAP